MTGQDLAATLTEAGLPAEAVARKTALIDRSASALRRLTAEAGSARVRALHVPGRLEVFGKHTDYAGGRSLICTTERGIVAVSVPRDDGRIVVVDTSDDCVVEVDLACDAAASGPSWATYVEAVARRVARNFPARSAGATIAFASDLPQAAGLSSSSALVVAVFQALASVSAIENSAEYLGAIRTPEDLAGYLATVENGLGFGGLAGDRGVGTFGGSEDHTAMLCCRTGWLSQYAFCPVRRELEVALPEDVTFVVGSSGVIAQKTGAARDAYNRAALAAREILDRWNRATGRGDASLAAACAYAPDRPDAIREAISRSGDGAGFTVAALRDRFDQFCEESLSIVPAAAAALTAGDLAAVGALADRSQHLAVGQLGNQVAETEHLARSAGRLGAIASSAFGAGFGGSVWALVAREQAPRFMDSWRQDYIERFPSRSTRCAFFTTRPGPPVIRS